MQRVVVDQVFLSHVESCTIGLLPELIGGANPWAPIIGEFEPVERFALSVPDSKVAKVALTAGCYHRGMRSRPTQNNAHPRGKLASESAITLNSA